MNSDENRVSIPLNLYLNYDYLPIDQQANLLLIFDHTFKILSIIAIEIEIEKRLKFNINLKQYKRYHQYLLYYLHAYKVERMHLTLQQKMAPHDWDNFLPPLSILSAKTGNSIDIGFDISKNRLPKLKSKEGKLIIEIPKWGAIVVLTGALLTSGTFFTNQVLEANKKLLEIEKLKYEINKLDTEIKEITESSEEMKKLYELIEYNKLLLSDQIDKPNIQDAKLNNIKIKKQDTVFM